MKGFLIKIFDLVYPKCAVCMGCGDKRGFEGEWICPECRQGLAKRWIGAFHDGKLDGAAAAYRYSGPAGSIVRSMKYGGAWGLKEIMVPDMLRALKRIQPIGADCIAAVPMHPKRLKKRGFNQSEVLAKEIAARLELPCEDCLIRTRNTVQQARLKGSARRKNMKDAVEAKPTVVGRRVLLVDDVYTTGATAHECARALRAAGAVSVSYLAYAKGK